MRRMVKGDIASKNADYAILWLLFCVVFMILKLAPVLWMFML